MAKSIHSQKIRDQPRKNNACLVYTLDWYAVLVCFCILRWRMLVTQHRGVFLVNKVNDVFSHFQCGLWNI